MILKEPFVDVKQHCLPFDVSSYYEQSAVENTQNLDALCLVFGTGIVVVYIHYIYT